MQLTLLDIGGEAQVYMKRTSLYETRKSYMKRTFASRAKRGSATIEASLVIPLLILIIVGIIKIAGVREVRVRENSTENIKSTLEYLKDDATNPEDLLRLRWTAGYK